SYGFPCGLGRLTDRIDPGSFQLVYERAIPGFLRKGADRGGHDRTELGGRLKLLLGCLHEAVHGAVVSGQCRGCLLSDMPDAERVHEPPEVVGLAALDLPGDVTSDLAELSRNRALRLRIARRDDDVLKRVGGQVIQVREVVDKALGEQLIDERFAEAFDVHGRARREVLEAAAQAGGTRGV